MRQMMSQQRLWNQLEGFTHQIHGSLDLKETAYAVVNDGKRLVGCDRLSVALKIGGRTMVEAVSGQEVVEQRSNLVRELTRLCKVVIRSGEDLVYTGNTDGLAPDIRDALEMYVDESGSKVVVVTLLHKPETIGEEGTDNKDKEKVPFGCLVAEQIGDELAPTDMHARTEVVSRHASTALWNAQEHHKIFLKPVLKALGSPWRMFRGRTLAKIGAVLAGGPLVFVAAMAFVPCTLTIEGHGSLLPEERHKIYAPVAGIVARGAGRSRCTGQEGRRPRQARKQRPAERAQGPDGRHGRRPRVRSCSSDCRQEKATRRAAGRRRNQSRYRAQLAEAKITAKSAKERIEIINEQIESMDIRSPQDGIITTWEARKNLMGRPVEIGTELLQVAGDRRRWVLEVEVPDDDMGPILAAKSKLDEDIKAGRKKVGSTLPAYFVTMTDPEHRYPATSCGSPRAPRTWPNRAIQEPPYRQGDDRLQRGGPPGLPEAQRDQGDAAGRRGPCPGQLRPDQPGLLPAPQADPGLLRIGAVPLAVLALSGPIWPGRRRRRGRQLSDPA